MKLYPIFLLSALAALTACTAIETENPEVPTSEPEQSDAPKMDGNVFAGQAIVEFDDAMLALIESELEAGLVPTKSAPLSAAITDLGIASLERVFPDAGIYEPRSRAFGMHRFYQVTYRDDIPVTKALTTLKDMPGILSVDPVRPVRKRVSFNDPYLDKQWHYTGANGSANINVEGVWENYTTGRSNVIVCVVDEPVDATHPDLQDNLWYDEEGHTGYNFARGTYDLTIRPENGKGDQGHGTHVAGTVAAVNNNGIGLCGVAGGNKDAGIPGVRLQSCAIFSGKEQASDAGSCNAIKWGADHGAVISQNSWGYFADQNGDNDVSNSELAKYKQTKITSAEKAAINYFITYAGCDVEGNQLADSPMKGGLVIFACGNEAIDYDVISSYEPVISVGAFGPSGSRASYSNYGSYVDVAAPGGEGYQENDSVWSTLPYRAADGRSVVTTDYYGGVGWAGTSMACPHVSGVAALIISYFGKSGFTADDAKTILFAGLGDVIGGSRPIGGKLDALASFEWALEHGYVPAESAAKDPLPPVISLSSVPVEVLADAQLVLPFTVQDPNLDKFTVSFTPGSPAAILSSSSTGNYTLTIIGSAAPAGTYTAIVKATDETGLSSTVELSYTIFPKAAPVVQLDRKEVTLKVYESAEIHVTASDPNGDPVTVSIDPGSAAATLSEAEDGSSWVVTIAGNGAPAGSYSGSVRVTNDAGRYSEAAFAYTLLENNAPDIAVDQTSLTLRAYESVSLDILIRDPDGDPYEVSNLDPGSKAAKFTQLGEGKYTLSINARDGEAGTYAASVKATDRGGLITEVRIVYTILPNHAPQVVREVGTLYFDGMEEGKTLDFSPLFSDPDGDKLSFSADIVGNKNCRLTVTGSSVRVVPSDYGYATIVITASDILGASATMECPVYVNNPESRAVQSFPNPMTDVLNVRIDSEKATVQVRLLSSSGSEVLARTVEGASCFTPIALDVHSIAPGSYQLKVSYEGKTSSQTVVKH